MIISTHIDVKISNQGKYYASLGYADTRQGSIIKVKIEDLPKNSNKIVECKCDECGSHFGRSYQLLNKAKKLYDKHLCFQCSRETVGELHNKETRQKQLRKQTGANHPRWNPNKSAYKAYAAKVRLFTEQNYAENIDLINPMGLPRTVCGVDGGYQLDHRVSIKKGFMFGVNPKIIGSAQNLQMLPWKENRDKAA